MLDKNLEILSQKNPILGKKLEAHGCNDAELVKAKKSEQDSLTFQGQYLISKYDPVREARQLVDGMDLFKTKCILVYGLGLGYHIDELINAKPECNIIVYEPSLEVIKYCLQKDYLLPLVYDKLFIVSGAAHEIDEQLHRYLMFNVNLVFNAETMILPGYETVFGLEVFKVFTNRFRESVKFALYTGGNDLLDTLVGVRNMFANVKEIFQSPKASALKGCMQGKPAICVSSGPSLDLTIKHLKGLEDRAVIFAADSALKALLDNGVIPHFVTAVERVEKIFEYFFSNPANLSQKVTLIALDVVDPRVFQNYPGRKIVIGRNIYTDQWLREQIGDFLISEVGHSVAHMNLILAYYMGCGPIILVGQDLCNAADGSITHSKYTVYSELPEEELRVLKNRKIIHIEGNDQSLVPTTEVLANQLEWFVKFIPTLGVDVINATIGGAKIPGAHRMDIQTAITRYCQQNYQAEDFLIKNLEPVVTDINSGIEKLVASCTRLVEELTQILDQIQTLQKELPLLKNLAEEQKGEELKAKLDFFETTIGKTWEHQVAWTLFQPINVVHSIKKHSLPTTLMEEDLDQLYEIYQDYFSQVSLALIRSIGLFREIIDYIPEQFSDV